MTNGSLLAFILLHLSKPATQQQQHQLKEKRCVLFAQIQPYSPPNTYKLLPRVLNQRVLYAVRVTYCE
ncbi:hypothetical protein M0802_010879 [Mischocyttarus mexicanus]|nr:hypothetical protein M0802_010879 [Mischocyttarus mexicanus]